MGRDISKEELIIHKEKAISKLSAYIDSLIESGDPKLLSKSDKLSFWLKDWASFFRFRKYIFSEQFKKI